MDYVQTARLLALESRAYLADILPLARDTLKATLEATRLFLRLLFRLSRPLLLLISFLLRLITPLLRLLSLQIWTFFCLQPAHILAAEAALAALTLLLVLLERRFALLRRLHAATIGASRQLARRYRTIIRSVRAKSRTAAAALPHILYLTLAALSHHTAGHIIAPLTQGAGMLTLAVALPAWTTIRLLYAVDIDSPPLPPADAASSDPPSPPSPSPPSSPSLPSSPSPATPSPPTRSSLRRRASTASSRARAAAAARDINNASDAPATRVSINTTPLVRALPPPRTPSPRAPRRRTAFTAADDAALREVRERAVLRFWVIFGFAWAARSLAWYFTPALLAHAVPQLDTLLFWFFLWAQLAMTDGAALVYRMLAGVARRRWRLDERRRRADGRLEQLGVVMRLLVAARVVRADRAATLTTNVAESGFALVGVVFLITPRVATFVGTLLIGLLVPCYLSTGVLEAGVDEAFALHNWLSYWAVFAVMDGWLALSSDMIGWLPLWYHAKMVWILWLQLPYYRGSVVVLDYLMGRVGSALSTVRKQTVTPRKRKRA